jgi:aminocarboxymuconate-semialdehyde decarboxylase
MTIDVHAHCIPEGVVEALEADAGAYGIEVVERDGKRRAVISGRVETGPLRPDFFDVDARLAAMDATGVEVQLLSGWIDMSAYALADSAGTRYARMFNEALAATVGQHPDRFSGLCTVPLQAPAAAADELRFAVAELGMVGVEIATTVDGRDLDDPELEPFWATAEELQAIVLIHPYASLSGRGVSRYFLGNLVGNPAESTVAVAHLIFGGVLEKHPDLKVCLVHGGGFAPYQAGRWDRGYDANPMGAAKNLTRPPSEWLRKLYFDTVLHSPASLRFLIDFVGAEQVVLGSDYPFEMGEPAPLETIDGVKGLTGEERDLIVRGNLEQLIAGVQR